MITKAIKDFIHEKRNEMINNGKNFNEIAPTFLKMNNLILKNSKFKTIDKQRNNPISTISLIDNFVLLFI